jgi:hypothetical protein
MQIESDVGKISLGEWENGLKLSTPFTIEEVCIFVDTFDGEKSGAMIKVSEQNPIVAFKDIAFTLRSTAAGSAYGLDITSAEEHSLKIQFTALVRLAQKNVRPAFVFEKEVK